LTRRAPCSRHPKREDYEAQARAYLEGAWALEDLTPASLLLHSPAKGKPARRRHKRK